MKKKEYLPPHLLIDTILVQQRLKNDAALCRALEVRPATISKIRNGINRLSPEIVLRLHETFGIPVSDIRSLSRQ